MSHAQHVSHVGISLPLSGVKSDDQIRRAVEEVSTCCWILIFLLTRSIPSHACLIVRQKRLLTWNSYFTSYFLNDANLYFIMTEVAEIV